MSRLKVLALWFLLILTLPVFSQSQTMNVGQVMRQHRKAIGGIDAITSFVTAELELVRTSNQGSYPVKWFFGEESQFRENSKFFVNGESLSYDGNIAYQGNAFAGYSMSSHFPEGSPEDRYLNNIARTSSLLLPLMNVEKQGAALTVVSNNSREYVLQAVYPDGCTRIFTLNSRYELIKDETTLEASGLAITIAKKYSGHKEFDGAILPAGISVEITGYYLDRGIKRKVAESYKYLIKKAKGNIEIPQEYFTRKTPDNLSSGDVRETRSGRFYLAGKIPVGIKSTIIRISDINKDGKADLITANRKSLTITYGEGDLVFVEKQIVNPKGWSISDLLVEDINGDEYEDILLAVNGREHSGVIACFNNSGKLGQPEKLLANLKPGSFSLGNLNNAEGKDLAIWDKAAKKILLFAGSNKGRFAYMSSIPGSDAKSLLLEDLNEDGIDDIASIESSSVKVYFSANNKWVGNKIAERLKEPVSLSAADFNGDGFMDLAVGCGGEVKNSSDTGLGIISGMKGNAFSRPVFFDGGPGVSDVAWGDINGDKVMDLVTASFGNHKANIFLNQENQLVHSDSLPAGWSPSAILARDINGDGQTELLILNKWGKNLYIWENRTQGNRDAPDK